MQKGAIAQLTLKGDIDNKYLIGNPSYTFFRSKQNNHANFAIHSIKRHVNTEIDFGGNLEFTLDHKFGDLVTDLYLVFDLPRLTPSNNGRTLRWTDSIGHAIIQDITLLIDDTKIITHTGEFLEIYNNLTLCLSKEEGYNYLIGRNQLDSRVIDKVYVPLKFWFCNNFNQAFPLVAIQNHSLKIRVRLRPFSELWVTNTEDPSETTTPNCIPKLPNAYMLTDVAYLDKPERRWFAQTPHSILIKQVQISPYGIAANIRQQQLEMNFNHPVSELIWVIQRLDATDNGKNDWFNYSSQTNPTNNVYQDALDEAKISFESNDLIEFQDALYFRIVMPLKYHTRIPERNIYDYCFAIYPESYHATGSANFGVINKKLLHLKFTTGIAASRMNIYAINYNILHLKKGSAGLEYNQ